MRTLVIILNLFLFLQVGWSQSENNDTTNEKNIHTDEYKMNSEPSDCDKVKNGKFKIPVQGTDFVSFIERKDSIQVETLNGEMACKFKIKWLTTCKYEMTVMMCKDESMNEMFGDMILINNIYEVTDTGYKFITQMNDEPVLVEGEAFTEKKANKKM